MSQSLTGAEQKALTLLGNGMPNHVVANATGLSDSRISQLLSEDWFKLQVTELRYKTLLKHNELDEKYDAIESRLATKLEGTTDLMFRPAEIARTLSIVNALKRRGVSSPDAIQTQQPTLSLVLPAIIIQQFVRSGNNQVVQVDEIPLITIQPEKLQQLSAEIYTNGLQSTNSLTSSNVGGKAVAEETAGTITKSASITSFRAKLNAIRARQSESLVNSASNSI